MAALDRSLALVASSIVLASCVSRPAPEPADTIRVGALLPFTGDLASVGENIERGLLIAIETVNEEAGGVGGRPLTLVSRDTHSDPVRGMAAAQALLDAGVEVIIGPEEGDLADALEPLVAARGIPLLTISEAASSDSAHEALRFHLGPTAAAEGRALAQRMFRDRRQRASIISAQGTYGDSFAEGVRAELTRLGGSIISHERFDPAIEDRSVLERALDDEPDALVLVAYPRSGARIVMDAAALGATVSWYFAPTLNDDAFVANISPGLLDGAVGVSPEVGDEAAAFRAAFRARWSDERPLQITHFYYDALILWALAAERVEQSGGSISDVLRDTSRPTGQLFAWYEVEAAFAAVREGAEIDYCGASSSVDLTDEHELAMPFLGFWTIEEDRIHREPAVFRSLCHFIGG